MMMEHGWREERRRSTTAASLPSLKKNKKENKQERQKMAYAFHFSIERTGRRLRNFKTFTDSRMNCRVSRSVGSRVR